MSTIKVILGADLLKAVDKAARRTRTSRSALVREALRAHLTRLSLLEKEERDRDGYMRYPDSMNEASVEV